MIILILLASFISTFISIILLRPLSFVLGLVDIPNDRKLHQTNIPCIGGICIFIGLLTSQFYVNEFDKFSIVLLVTSFVILTLGVIDDLLNLGAMLRLLIQILVALVMISFSDIKLESFGNIFGLSSPLDIGVLSIPITVIAVVSLINAFNMTDGIDGLAGSLALIAFGGIFCFEGLPIGLNLTNIILGIIASLIPFLIFNLSSYKIKIFLGDGGSMFIGYLVVWTLIYCSQNVSNFVPSFALWCITIPLYDFLTVIFLRIIKKESFMKADRKHLHHMLEQLGMPKNLIVVVIITFASITFLLGYLIENYIPFLSVPIFIILFLLYFYFSFYISSVRKV